MNGPKYFSFNIQEGDLLKHGLRFDESRSSGTKQSSASVPDGSGADPDLALFTTALNLSKVKFDEL